MAIIITSCTNRKKGIANPDLCQSSLFPGTLDSVAQQWLAKLKVADATRPAREIYCGRGFREAEASSIVLNSPLYVVSAGLGLINSDNFVPTYNLSASSANNDSVLNKIIDDTSPRSWWSRISLGNSFSVSLVNVLNKYPEDIFLFALSRAYIDLIHDDLAECTLAQQQRFRFFGKNLQSFLPTSLTMNWMPYDDRLDEAGEGFGGTQSDFAQRSLRHFTSKILTNCENLDLDTHRSMVLASLSTLVKRESPNRQRLNDQEIANAIRKNWTKGKGQSSSLLRILRDELNIACEQKRFTTIFYSVKKLIGNAL